LNPRLRLKGLVAKEKEGGLHITPFCPRRQTREVLATLLEKGLAVDAIESVFKIDFQENLVGVIGVPGGPFPGRVDAHLGA
jgi:hypothetical protein